MVIWVKERQSVLDSLQRRPQRVPLLFSCSNTIGHRVMDN